MITSLKAEFRKLLTVRSTYFIVLISLAIVILVAGYGNGVKASIGNLNNHGFLNIEATHAVLFDGVLLAIATLLLIGHEYRYNGILYTLTSSNSRAKSLLAKLMVVTTFSVIFSLIITFFSPLCSLVGIHLAGHHLIHQTFQVGPVIWKCLFVGWGYSMFAFIIGVIVRSQVGSIVTFLLIPLVGEQIIEGVFKNSSKYLPFNSLQSVIGTNMPHTSANVSTAHNVTVACIYMAVGVIVSFVLFIKRDAN